MFELSVNVTITLSQLRHEGEWHREDANHLDNYFEQVLSAAILGLQVKIGDQIDALQAATPDEWQHLVLLFNTPVICLPNSDPRELEIGWLFVVHPTIGLFDGPPPGDWEVYDQPPIWTRSWPEGIDSELIMDRDGQRELAETLAECFRVGQRPG